MGKVLLVACTNVGRYIIETLMTDKSISSELVGVVNLNNKQGVAKANYDSYSDLLLKYDIPFFYCDNINDADCIEFIKNAVPDIILQSGWSQKFSDQVLSIPKYGCIGEHPAPLPKGRGAACINWAILTGETQWGDSYFKMVSEYDKGELYAQSYFNIELYDNVFTVYEKVACGAQKIISEYIDKWTSGEFKITNQSDSDATYYKKRRPTDGEILTFECNAVALHNFIRAQTFPYPGAYVTTNYGKIILLSTCMHDDLTSAATPGTVIGKTQNGGVLVTCKDGAVLEILRVKRENMPSEWAGDVFGINRSIFDIK